MWESGAAAVVLASTSVGLAQDGTPTFSLSLRGPATASAGSHVMMYVTLRNTSDHVVAFDGEGRAERDFRIDVVDSGVPIQRT
jgi:hypothetical protein